MTAEPHHIGRETWLTKLQRRILGNVRRRPILRFLPFEDLEPRLVMTAVINVIPITELVTTESGGTAQIGVSLSQQPKRPVKIPVKSSHVAEGIVSVKQLVFNKVNWDQVQTVTVKGVEDSLADGSQAYSLVLGPAKGDKLFRKIDPIDPTLVNHDSGPPSIEISANGNLQTTEGGGTTSFSIKLSSKPTANVIIPLRSTKDLEGTVAASVTFTPTNWNQAKTITITGVNDSTVDGHQEFQIVLDPAMSADSRYAGLSAPPISITNLDNDIAGLQITPISTLNIFEGFSKDVSVRLRSQPTANVVVSIESKIGANQAGLFVTSLVFTPASWNVPQTISITGKLADGVDGDQPYSVELSTTSSDQAFDALPPRTVNAMIIDTDGQPLAGEYIGAYSGSVIFFGFPFFPQTGDVAFSVANDLLTVTKPDDASGSISNGSGTFAPTAGPLLGGVYTGIFTLNSDGSVDVGGTWTYFFNGNTGAGIWTASRPAPMAL